MDLIGIFLVIGFAIIIVATALPRLFRGTVNRQMPGGRRNDGGDGGAVGFVDGGRNHGEGGDGDGDGGGGGGGD